MTAKQLPIDFTAAREARDEGMERALANAERSCEKWGDLAFRFLESYCRRNLNFISEDVSDASKSYGLIQPPTDRAWGSVYLRAVRAGMIVQDGTGRSRRRHASLCPRWRSTIYGRAA